MSKQLALAVTYLGLLGATRRICPGMVSETRR